MEKLLKGYCFESSTGDQFLIMGDAVDHKEGKTVYLCQELTGAHRLMIWTGEEIQHCKAGDTGSRAFSDKGDAGSFETSGADVSAAANFQENKRASFSFGSRNRQESDESTISFEASERKKKEQEENLQRQLLHFLDASSCAEKLEILGGMKGKITDSMLESMAISLDYELGGGSVEEKYYALERFLKTRNRYETTRLRK